MKNKNIIFIILSVIIVIVTFIFVNEIIPIMNEKDCKNIVFDEM